MKGIEELLIDEKVEGMILNTERDYPSCNFYEKNGFEIFMIKLYAYYFIWIGVIST